MRRTSIVAAATAATVLVAGVGLAMTGPTLPGDVGSSAADDRDRAGRAPDDHPSSPTPSPSSADRPSPDDDPSLHASTPPDDDPSPRLGPSPEGRPTAGRHRTDPARTETFLPAGSRVESFAVLDVGWVTIRVGDVVELVDAAAADGSWRVVTEIGDGDRELEVSFRAGGDLRVDWKAELEDGQLRIRTRDRRIEDAEDRSGSSRSDTTDDDGDHDDGDHDDGDDRSGSSSDD